MNHHTMNQSTTSPSANASLGLPRDKMRRFVVAIDVDGTLRCNHDEFCELPNQRIVDLARTLASFKNIKVMVWSGAGQAYAARFVRKFDLDDVCSAASKLDPSTWPWGRPNVAIDDIQDTVIADMNWIVREK